MQTISMAEAQSKIPRLIQSLKAGDEMLITVNQIPVARLVGESAPVVDKRILGTMAGTVLYMAPDFDAPLEEFREYMK